MDQVISTVGSALGGFFDTPVIQFGLRAIAAYVVVVWIATSYWAFRDMQTRSDNPILPYVAASLIILFTPVLFLFAALIYRLVRPHEKIAEATERSLAEEALLNEVDAVPHCNRLVGLDWSLCAWCGKDFERREPIGATVGATPAPYPVAAAAAAAAASVVGASVASSIDLPVATPPVDTETTRTRRSPRATGPRAPRAGSDPLPER
jgi:hypothetical protein